jgi:hypothetical protein
VIFLVGQRDDVPHFEFLEIGQIPADHDALLLAILVAQHFTLEDLQLAEHVGAGRPALDHHHGGAPTVDRDAVYQARPHLAHASQRGNLVGHRLGQGRGQRADRIGARHDQPYVSIGVDVQERIAKAVGQAHQDYHQGHGDPHAGHGQSGSGPAPQHVLEYEGGKPHE